MAGRIIICKNCGHEAKHYAKQLCASCYDKLVRRRDGAFQFNFAFQGERSSAWVRDHTWQEAREYYEYKKKEILQDCIDNPEKYLSEVDNGGCDGTVTETEERKEKTYL